MGNFQSGEYFAFKVIGHDFDGNTIGYDFVDLPSELTGDVQTGWITGYPSLASTGISSYSFSVSVYKTGKPEYASPFFNFAYNLEKDITSTIVWISDSDLGQIFNGTISTSAVVAESDVELSYRITSGSLPPNLTLSSNGEIIGRVADQPTNTLLDQGDTTEFTFTVQAYSPIFPAVGSSKSFTLTVLQEFSQPTDTLYIQATPSINDRQLLASLLDNDTLIPPNALYRSNDQYFGKATSVIYEHAYGIYASDIEEYIVAVTRNHYWRNITLGELKTAVAKNSAGEIIYEVVYSEVIDNLVNPSGTSIQQEIVWPRPIDLGLGPWYTSITDIFTSYYFGKPGNTLAVTATTVTTNQLTCSSTVGLLPGREVIFSGTTFGNIVAGTTYYVSTVANATAFTVATTAGGAARDVGTSSQAFNGNPTSYLYVCTADFNSTVNAKSVSNTFSSGNIIELNNTSSLAVNAPIIFTGNVDTANTNLVANNVYYIKTIASPNITISGTRVAGTAGGVVAIGTKANANITATAIIGTDIWKRIELTSW